MTTIVKGSKVQKNNRATEVQKSTKKVRGVNSKDGTEIEKYSATKIEPRGRKLEPHAGQHKGRMKGPKQEAVTDDKG